MTDRLVRLYATSIAIVVFFVSWAAIAAKPWASSTAAPDPRLAALHARELRLQRQSVVVKHQVDRRWAAYRTALAGQRRLASVTPSVRVVNLPPITITRTS